MADNFITLICITDGDSTPFSVDIDPSKTVDHLKVSIHAKLEIDTPSKDLTLWRVSVPLVPLKERKPITLSEFESAAELHSTDDISDTFEEKPRKKTVVVIVQRPLQGNADASLFQWPSRLRQLDILILIHKPNIVHTPIPARASTALPTLSAMTPSGLKSFDATQLPASIRGMFASSSRLIVCLVNEGLMQAMYLPDINLAPMDGLGPVALLKAPRSSNCGVVGSYPTN